MNDQEIAAAVRSSFADIELNAPVERVLASGRARRRRGALMATGVVLFMVLSATVTAAVAVASDHGASSAAPKDDLAAWTVTKEASGTVTVTVRQLADPAGLQAALRADGIPASVIFLSRAYQELPLPAGCQAAPLTGQQVAAYQRKIYDWGRFRLTPAMVIHPAEIPAGLGIELGVNATYATVDGKTVNTYFGWSANLVVASQSCTGS